MWLCSAAWSFLPCVASVCENKKFDIKAVNIIIALIYCSDYVSNEILLKSHFYLNQIETNWGTCIRTTAEVNPKRNPSIVHPFILMTKLEIQEIFIYVYNGYYQEYHTKCTFILVLKHWAVWVLLKSKLEYF